MATTTEGAPVAHESLYDLFAVNNNEAEDGKWFQMGREIWLKIRRFKSKKSVKVRTALEAPYARVNRRGTQLPEDVQEEITAHHLAEGIVADWKGIYDKSGQPVPYTKENAFAFISDPLLREFRDRIAEISIDINNYIDDKEVDEEKN